MRQLDLFSGIGGFALAARWMGWETVGFVEIDKFCQKVLNKNFPNIPIHGDIKTFNGESLRGTVDIITGGFPCQTFSLAGKGALDLSLWKEMFRAVKEVGPRWVVAENVYGILARKKGLALETVCTDLENEGYTVFPPVIIPACATGAPHRRDRVWIIAHSNRHGCKLQSGSGGRQANESEIKENKWQWFRHEFTGNALQGAAANTDTQRLAGRIHTGQSCNEKTYGTLKGREFTRTYPKDDWSEFPTVSPISIRNDGVPKNMVRFTDGTSSRFNERQVKARIRKEGIKGSGNAISPQVVFEIFKAIEQVTIDYQFEQK